MTRWKFKRIFTIFAIILILTLICGSDINTISGIVELESLQETINVGEPFVCKITYRFDDIKDDSITSIRHSAKIRIWKANDPNNEIQIQLFDPENLYQDNLAKTDFSNTFVLLYSYDNKRLVFNTPGVFNIQVVASRQRSSNVLTINVNESTEASKRTVLMLQNPEVYRMVAGGFSSEPNVHSLEIAQLEKVTKVCNGSVFSNWTSARLGLEYLDTLLDKYRALNELKAGLEKGLVDERSFNSAQIHLQMAKKLPDGFPIRREVLFGIASLAYVNDDIQQVITLFDEIITKYPYTKYAKWAEKGKKEIEEMRVVSDNTGITFIIVKRPEQFYDPNATWINLYRDNRFSCRSVIPVLRSRQEFVLPEKCELGGEYLLAFQSKNRILPWIYIQKIMKQRIILPLEADWEFDTTKLTSIELTCNGISRLTKFKSICLYYNENSKLPLYNIQVDNDHLNDKKDLWTQEVKIAPSTYFVRAIGNYKIDNEEMGLITIREEPGEVYNLSFK